MGVASTEYEHTIEFLLDGVEVSEWICGDSHVVGTPAVTSLDITKLSMRKTFNGVKTWNYNLMTGAWGVKPEKAELTAGYSSETSWADSDSIRQELQIGDLSWELIYNRLSDMYQLTRTVFDLKWIDYLWFVKNWERFLYPEGE